MNALRRYFERNSQEISEDGVLRAVGVCLAITHVLSFLSWKINYGGLEKILSEGQRFVCWPFFEACDQIRFLSPGGVAAVLWVYLACSVLVLGLFAWKGKGGIAYAGLCLLTLFKLFILIQDYRLRLNQHYMSLFSTIVFLFLPDKRRLFQYQLAFFYFWAGTLKLDHEWLSGEALYRKEHLWVPDALIPASCVYVAVLELVIVWGIFSRNRWVFWSTFAQLVLFHIYSFPIVGFFYPLLMFALLSIFPLTRLEETGVLGKWGFPAPAASTPRPLMPGDFLRGREKKSTYAWLGFFSLLQIVPYLFPGDSAVTGEGRLFALHMFDARVQCEAKVTYKGKDGEAKTRDITIPGDAGRMRCDPLIYWNMARNYCRQGEKKGKVPELDLAMSARRATDAEMRPVVDVKNFCMNPPTYELFWPNEWILK
ncbi:MAG: hypothetical protein AB1405_02305 [Bdellovibrionota bacterium]